MIKIHLADHEAPFGSLLHPVKEREDHDHALDPDLAPMPVLVAPVGDGAKPGECSLGVSRVPEGETYLRRAGHPGCMVCLK